MKVSIGFLHNRDSVVIDFIGDFSVLDETGKELYLLSGKVDIKLSKSVKADYQWYEKVDTFYEIDEMEKVKEKSYYGNKKYRVIKVGKEINNRINNFEYWVLKRVNTSEGKKSSNILNNDSDYKYKKIIRKKGTGELELKGNNYSNSLKFKPISKDAKFMISNVTVGIGFHWQYDESLVYNGELEVIIDNDGKITLINIVELEEYLASVNSSEMRNDNNLEMLKAQTVAARGTILATMGKHHFDEGFDICADDHCQCYQGTNRITELSREVTLATKDEVLFFDTKICDTRYAKICGGITEAFSTCWDDYDHYYLPAMIDSKNNVENNGSIFKERMDNKTAKEFIDNLDYDCFCNTKQNTLPKSLDFCNDNFRWEESVSSGFIKSNLEKLYSVNIGDITSMEVISRGKSGRIDYLKIIGTKGEKIVSKELKIRKVLSTSHLLSSCFYISETDNNNQNKEKIFKLTGAGWGHGVGLCQVGAEIMGQKGYNYKEILSFYYRNAKLMKI